MANPYSERTISLRVAKKYITNGYAVHMIDDEFAPTERVTEKRLEVTAQTHVSLLPKIWFYAEMSAIIKNA